MAEATETIRRAEGEVDDFPFVRRIDLGLDGGGVQEFRGRTQEELDDALAEAIANGTRKIQELNRERKDLKRIELLDEEQTEPAPRVLEFKPRELSTNEAFAISQKLNNPATARQGMRELLEAELGAPLETVRERLTEADLERLAREATTAVDWFRSTHPEYRVTQHNADEMQKFLMERDLKWSRKNLEIAFRKLSRAGLLELSAAGGDAGGAGGNGNGSSAAGADTPADSGETARTRPRGTVSTSIVPGGRRAPAPTTTKMPSREEIDRMSTTEYNKRLKDPAFERYVDSLPPR